jgi:hypothetical protein
MRTQRPIGHRTTNPYAGFNPSPGYKRYNDALLHFGLVLFRLSAEVVRRGLNPRVFQRWLERKREPFYRHGVS